MSNTIRYKHGFIHLNTINGRDIVRYQIDGQYNTVKAKSLHAAKIAITFSEDTTKHKKVA